jgi:hypothetical protein
MSPYIMTLTRCGGQVPRDRTGKRLNKDGVGSVADLTKVCSGRGGRKRYCHDGDYATRTLSPDFGLAPELPSAAEICWQTL